MKNYKPIPFIALILSSLIILGSSNQVIAQEELSRVNLYTQFGAVPGLEATLNVEMRFFSGDKVTWYGRAGVGFGGMLLIGGGPGGIGAVTMLTGKRSSHFELNGGVYIGYDRGYSDILYLPSLDIGYRYQKPEGGFLFKTKIGILGVGFAVGYAF